MNSIYDFLDYRKYLLKRIEETGQKGLQRKLAEACCVSPTLISLVLKKEKHLSLEQASDISDFFDLTEKETEFFFLLVELGKAGSVRLQNKLKKQITDFVFKMSRRVQAEELSESVKGVFYSSWIYSAIRNLTAIESYDNVQAISKRLGLSAKVTQDVIEYLLAHTLCVKAGSKLSFGPQNTHLNSDSPMVIQHHRNWRLRGFQEMDLRKDENLFYTCPMSTSKEVAQKIRLLLPKIIENILKEVGPSKSESLFCFNLDWFGL